MLLKGIQNSPVRTLQRQTIKANPQQQNLKNAVTPKSNFGLYNLSSRYGISFGSLNDSRTPTEIEELHSFYTARDQGQSWTVEDFKKALATPYSSEEIEREIRTCIRHCRDKRISPTGWWVEVISKRIANLGFSNQFLNRFFREVERIAGQYDITPYDIFDACDCINSDNKETVEKIFNATYNWEDEKRPVVGARYLAEILKESKGKEDILDVLLSVKTTEDQGRYERPLLHGEDYPDILRACNPENKQYLMEWIENKVDEINSKGYCRMANDDEVKELIKGLQEYKA